MRKLDSPDQSYRIKATKLSSVTLVLTKRWLPKTPGSIPQSVIL
jgi:hypothetical protein